MKEADGSHLEYRIMSTAPEFWITRAARAISASGEYLLVSESVDWSTCLVVADDIFVEAAARGCCVC